LANHEWNGSADKLFCQDYIVCQMMVNALDLTLVFPRSDPGLTPV
jgi:hypothetical protein